MFRKAASFPPEERLSFMASGRRAGGDLFNLVVREKKVLAFQFFLSELGIGKYFAAFTLLRGKRYRSG